MRAKLRGPPPGPVECSMTRLAPIDGTLVRVPCDAHAYAFVIETEWITEPAGPLAARRKVPVTRLRAVCKSHLRNVRKPVTMPLSKGYARWILEQVLLS